MFALSRLYTSGVARTRVPPTRKIFAARTSSCVRSECFDWLLILVVVSYDLGQMRLPAIPAWWGSRAFVRSHGLSPALTTHLHKSLCALSHRALSDVHVVFRVDPDRVRRQELPPTGAGFTEGADDGARFALEDIDSASFCRRTSATVIRDVNIFLLRVA